LPGLDDVSELAVAVGSSDAEGERTVEGVRVVGPDDASEAFEENDVDAVIDFSTPEGTEVAARSAAAVGAVLVTGTTALDTDAEEAVDAAADEVPVVRSSNFAKGVNVFWEVVEEAARLLPDADFEVTETHHRHKRDAPSGTALTAVERIEEAVGERDRVHGREGDSKRGDEIGVHARRGGDIPGEHEVLIASEDES
ncbi:MAG: 4-hydroxy-tetrahydrodipicolinate reductase, partial [Halobacteria archaeon]|nr:4-hydroxy-tetrahydrodipicolinate reductase [Halobacteria archaeon]